MSIKYTQEPLAGMGTLVWKHQSNCLREQLGWVMCSCDHKYRWQLLGKKVNKDYYATIDLAVEALIVASEGGKQT